MGLLILNFRPARLSADAQTSEPRRHHDAAKIGEYVQAEPFRPFLIGMASGQTFEIRHPEMILVGRNSVRVYANLQGNGDTPPQWHDVSMMLMETIEPGVASANTGN